MSDTTAQEAKIPYPTEVGLMSRFVDQVKNQVKKVGKAFSGVKTKVKEVVKKVKGLVRSYHLFSKDKGSKKKTAKKIYHIVESVQNELDQVFDDFQCRGSKASAELQRLWEVITVLLPQIKHFYRDRFCSQQKNHSPEDVSTLFHRSRERWQANRVWYQMGYQSNGWWLCQWFRHGVLQTCFRHQILSSGHTRTYKNLWRSPRDLRLRPRRVFKGKYQKMKKLGVKNIGIAPKGKSSWEVSQTKQKTIKREWAQVEGVIGTIKSGKYKFNKPGAHSITAMESCGHRSILGFNLVKLMKENQNLLFQGM